MGAAGRIPVAFATTINPNEEGTVQHVELGTKDGRVTAQCKGADGTWNNLVLAEHITSEVHWALDEDIATRLAVEEAYAELAWLADA